MTVLQKPADQPIERREPTLGAELTRFARTAVPSRLYKLLQFGIPFALDFGLHDYWRAAAWGVAISSLGAWGLADRWLFTTPLRQGRKATFMRFARVVCGTLAAGLAGALLIELFLRLLGNAPIS
jgi:putative flippase GtrA